MVQRAVFGSRLGLGFGLALGLGAMAAGSLAACSSSSSGGAGSSGSSGAQGNVDFAATCTVPAACGGDPTGTWDLASACVELADGCATGSGTIKGTLILSSATYSIDTTSSFTACDKADDSSAGNSSTATITGTTIDFGSSIGVLSFCVDSDSLTLFGSGKKYPDPAVQIFTRHVADGGAD